MKSCPNTCDEANNQSTVGATNFGN